MQTESTINRSALFTAFNCARPLARQGYIDGNRLNRALGIAQSSKPSQYITTADRCSCPDSSYRHVTCKHQIALMLTSVSA
jgi:hypothetical protein